MQECYHSFMQEQRLPIFILLVVIVLAAAGYWYYQHQAPTGSATISGITASTTGGSYTTTTSDEEDLTVAEVGSAILGQWGGASSTALSFLATGAVVAKLTATSTPESGQWSLYTSTDAPADLSNLVLEPDHVFLRLTFSSAHSDYLVVVADSGKLELGPIGVGGLYSFTRAQ